MLFCKYVCINVHSLGKLFAIPAIFSCTSRSCTVRVEKELLHNNPTNGWCVRQYVPTNHFCKYAHCFHEEAGLYAVNKLNAIHWLSSPAILNTTASAYQYSTRSYFTSRQTKAGDIGMLRNSRDTGMLRNSRLSFVAWDVCSLQCRLPRMEPSMLLTFLSVQTLSLWPATHPKLFLARRCIDPCRVSPCHIPP